MMSGIRGKDTKPELLIRKALYARGYRYRLHIATLPGKPDLCFGPLRSVVFVNGCFWHGHQCHLFRLPKTRTDFWAEKIASNQQRDIQAHTKLLASGWRVLRVWECAIKSRHAQPTAQVIDMIVDWLEGDGDRSVDIRGTN
jgi:DNA mismatch endonuclease, patch repair protein